MHTLKIRLLHGNFKTLKKGPFLGPLQTIFGKYCRWENVPWECDFYALPTFHDCTPERWHSKQKCVNTERGCVLEKWVQLMQIFHERIQSHSTCCFCDICHKYLAILGKQSRLYIGDKVRGASYSATTQQTE